MSALQPPEQGSSPTVYCRVFVIEKRIVFPRWRSPRVLEGKLGIRTDDKLGLIQSQRRLLFALVECLKPIRTKNIEQTIRCPNQWIVLVARIHRDWRNAALCAILRVRALYIHVWCSLIPWIVRKWCMDISEGCCFDEPPFRRVCAFVRSII